jgi:hypothetical protein
MSFETYKGIEFIRISALPKEEQAMILKTLDQTKIIKILRDNVVLKDCVQSRDYYEWKGKERQSVVAAPASAELVKELKLAFK